MVNINTNEMSRKKEKILHYKKMQHIYFLQSMIRYKPKTKPKKHYNSHKKLYKLFLPTYSHQCQYILQ